ncbi:MAG: S8 family peptidase [Planctomycetia bacterium]|nr:S8 family peptidase [Planctomycetia bacterium]
MSVRRRDRGLERPIRYRLPPFRVTAAYTQLSETIDWGLAMYHVPDHWRETAGRDVRVAVLDTGLELTHPDLRGAVDEVRDFTGSRFGAEDRVGHGTHTAGTIGARRNDVGVIGVAPECRLLIGKVLGDDGSGSDDVVAAGIDWAAQAGADVISMSLGSPVASSAIEDAVRRAVAAGKFIVCAAGNDGRLNSVNYPAKFDDTVAVGAVDRDGRICDFSSRGDEVDLCAPGQDVLSTYLRGGYAKLSGTSMATPFVSGVVALLLAKHRAYGGTTPVETPAQLIEHLQRTAIDAGPQGRDPAYGFGLIDPDAVLQDTPTTIAPMPSPVVDGPNNERFELGPLSINGRLGTLVFVPRDA